MNINRTNPTANCHPKTMAEIQMEKIIVPPDLRMTGKNFSSGKIRNFTLAKNFAMTTPIAASGPRNFFNLLESVGAPCPSPSSGRLSEYTGISLNRVCLDSRIAQIVKSGAEKRDHIPGQKRFLAFSGLKNRNFCRPPANPCSDARRIKRRQFLADKSGAYSG